MKVGNNTLDLSTPAVMTILNITPDSFWAGSRRATDDDIIHAVCVAAEQGATIIDVGGYSSRPGADDVSPEEEFRRVARGVKAVRERYPQMIVSIDTFRASVACRVVEEFGAVIVNDISAGDLDREMITTIAALGVPYIAMHMRATPATMQQHTEYDDVTDAVKEYFALKISQLRKAGVKDIIIDPGFGFAKSTRQNYQLLGRMEELLELGCPLLSGVSRKSMIYKVLDIEPEEAMVGTMALNWESLHKGASILRVHDTRQTVDVVKLFNYYTDTQQAR
jgi:dihydropteroate synthase